MRFFKVKRFDAEKKKTQKSGNLLYDEFFVPGQFRAYSIGGWFLEKVSSDNQKLLETKEKKIRATCETSAETSSRSQFHERQQGFTSFAIQDDLSAIEENSSPI